MNPAIRLDTVSKLYRLNEGRDSLRETVSNIASGLLGRRSRQQPDMLRALSDVSFELGKGEVLGVVGANGAGKSTILKLTAGITQPTEGTVEVNGRVGSLIELGAGFHPELTGRENVFLNGQIMGLSRKQIAARYQEIVDFAELADFMNTPVKRYSSGMYARLGFAVAAHLDPDILLVDEVLSVGDASFQRKSLERMTTLVDRGQAVLFVSHNLLAVERLCDRVLWLDHGRVIGFGKSNEVLQAYLSSEEARFVGDSQVRAIDGSRVAIERVRLLRGDGSTTTEFASGRDMHIQIEYRAKESVRGLRFGVGVTNARGVLFGANMIVDGHSVSSPQGDGTLHCAFHHVPLKPGAYQVFGEIWGPDGYDNVLPWSEWARFRVTDIDPLTLTLGDDHSVFHLHADAPFSVAYSWRGSDNGNSG